jgi:pSer/pThr/pTyr-binding forkhead associated (FHA) protein
VFKEDPVLDISLVMTTAAGEERPFFIRKERTVIGREAVTDVRIPIPRVARRHAEITLSDGELRLTDLGSDEGTLHNGERVREAVLSHDDRVQIGPVTFRVCVDGHTTRTATPPPPATHVAEVKPDGTGRRSQRLVE